jgi:adenylate kinase
MVLLGAPGVGKGTQAKILCDLHGWAHLSTGDMLRDAVQAGNPLGVKAKDAMNRGDLVEDGIILGLIEETLADLANRGFVLDGFPRTPAQAEGLDAILRRKGAELKWVVVLEVEDEEVVERLASRGRADDTPETVRHRLKVFKKSTEPLIGFYEAKGILRRVNGFGDIQEIHGRIESVLED